MMMTSHHKIIGKDESESRFSLPSVFELIHVALNRKYTCYKLPTRVCDLHFIKKHYPYAKILWIIRSPDAVVSSMKNVVFAHGKNWLQAEFPHTGKNELKNMRKLFPEIDSMDIDNLDDISVGALIWTYKIKAIDLCRQCNMHVYILKYEDLIIEAEKQLMNLCETIGLEYDNSMFRHEQHHANKKYFGGNIGNRHLDKTNASPELNLNREEKLKISEICRNETKPYYADA